MAGAPQRNCTKHKASGVLRDPAFTFGTAQFAAIQAMAPTVGVEVTPIGVRDAGEIESGIGALARISNAGLIVIGSALTAVHRHLIIALAAQHKLPAIYYERFPVKDGGLLSYWATFSGPVSACGRLRRPHP
jgi:ABC-type uncharacterized transport system substrate-binding protein